MVLFQIAPSGVSSTNIRAKLAAIEGDGIQNLLVTCAGMSSPPLVLPGRVIGGPMEVKTLQGHYEIKIPTHPMPSTVDDSPLPALLDAVHLQNSRPNSFICSSCSLPLVQAAGISMYRDLPSQHWEELVDAWMCHADQKLHHQIGKHSKGLLPSAGQALVGSGYILFTESAVSKGHILLVKSEKVIESFPPPPRSRTIKKTGISSH